MRSNNRIGVFKQMEALEKLKFFFQFRKKSPNF